MILMSIIVAYVFIAGFATAINLVDAASSSAWVPLYALACGFFWPLSLIRWGILIILTKLDRS